eukprot:CAMPEP_0184858210 /NCGR_PEP_ID=MMETSP0580-20130426/3334_1 /TAXON_ID=1118495 /ORGANISM="Dactyliosolen fragilissimus" /LENGTH=196 /DNA_ID=CAMNT_0027354239 /DNA_START=396 /DNA_END=983 /DNA_ORIENTATION=+
MESSSSGIIYLGMDAPELPLAEISLALKLSSRPMILDNATTIDHGRPYAYMNPTSDGGYGMICLPMHTDSSVFDGVRWSNPLTAISQLKVLSDHGMNIKIGSLMEDIDEPQDLIELAKRLCMRRSSVKSESKRNQSNNDNDKGFVQSKDALHISPAEKIPKLDQSLDCPHTFEACLETGIITRVKNCDQKEIKVTM